MKRITEKEKLEVLQADYETQQMHTETERDDYGLLLDAQYLGYNYKTIKDYYHMDNY